MLTYILAFVIELMMVAVSIFGPTFGVVRVFCVQFLLLFSLALNKSSCACENYDSSNGQRVLCPSYQRAMNDDEAQMFTQLLLLLDGYFASPNKENACIWMPDSIGFFSVKFFFGVVTGGHMLRVK